MQFLDHLLPLAAASPWALAAVAALLIVDGFFPFVPAETLVVAVTAAAVAAGGSPWIVLAVAVPAALAGDVIAYRLGRRLGTAHWAWMRRPRIAGAFGYAGRRLEASPASILLTAKFIPFVRVAVTMTAGASGMPVRRYLPLALASVTAYTGFHVAVGAAAASWLSNPLLAVLAAVAVAAGMGALVDLIGRALRRRPARPVLPARPQVPVVGPLA